MTRARDVATQGGLVLLNKQDFTAVSSVSFNNCFTSAYTNYRVLVNVTSVSSGYNVSLLMRLRQNGSDDSTSNYTQASFEIRDNGATTPVWYGAATNVTVGNVANFGRFTCNIDMYNPQKNLATDFNLLNTYGYSGQQVGRTIMNGMIYEAIKQFDGFTIYPASGNMTGTIRVYGYKD